MSPLLRLALPALAAAGTAYGTSLPRNAPALALSTAVLRANPSPTAACSNSATATVQNSGDASALASCTTFSGSIAIATGTTDDIALDGIQQIKGNLVADSNSGIQRISGADLETITGTLEINDVPQLASLNFPKLSEVNIVKMQGLPNLQTLGFDAEVTKASQIDIQNTFLENLQGLNIEEADVINIANNPQIAEIDMQVGNVTQQLTLSYNNADVNVSFPNLIWANNATFRACGSIQMQSLEALNDSLGIFESNLETFAAPNLTKVEKFLAIVGNKNLNNISFPQLANLGGNLQIANNSNLHEIDGFPSLEQVMGAFDISGNITKYVQPAHLMMSLRLLTEPGSKLRSSTL